MLYGLSIVVLAMKDEYHRGEQKGIALDWASPWRVHMLQAIPGFVNLHVASQNDPCILHDHSSEPLVVRKEGELYRCKNSAKE